MPRITWNNPGTRFYETGVDRGVLYVGTSPGVAWPGLVSISETPSGGEPKPHYIDGVKYLNLAKVEEYEATVEAFGCPREFLICDGTSEIHTGLYATQQPRSLFGLSYRTLIGNDADGSDHGYKLHLVYGALAAPTTRTYATTGDKTEPSKLSWSISTLPPSVTGIRRTSHYLVDSRYASPAVLSELEDFLYGTDSQYAALPTPTELISMFA